MAVQDPLGFEHEFEMERVWLLAIIDVCARAVLSDQIVLAREYCRYGVIRTIENWAYDAGLDQGCDLAQCVMPARTQGRQVSEAFTSCVSPEKAKHGRFRLYQASRSHQSTVNCYIREHIDTERGAQ